MAQRTSRALLIALGAALFVFAACGEEDLEFPGGGSPEPTSTPTPTATPTPTPTAG
jgi:hypothetical protein